MARGTSTREEAVEALTEALREGKQVGRCNLRDLIDGDLDRTYAMTVASIEEILLSEGDARDRLADQFRDGLIEKYLEANSDLVDDEIAELKAEGPDECDLSRAHAQDVADGYA